MPVIYDWVLRLPMEEVSTVDRTDYKGRRIFLELSERVSRNYSFTCEGHHTLEGVVTLYNQQTVLLRIYTGENVRGQWFKHQASRPI